MATPAAYARLAATLALLAATSAAEAETAPQPSQSRSCADRATVVDRLEKRFGEVRQAMGLNRSNAVVELYASAETGTWTILVTTPNGVSCMIAFGDLWESQTGPLRRPESDA